MFITMTIYLRKILVNVIILLKHPAEEIKHLGAKLIKGGWENKKKKYIVV